MEFEIEEVEGKLIVKMITSFIEIGRATCFIADTPKEKNKKVATIGEIEIENEEDGKLLIKKCLEVLKDKGFKYVVGPMNKTTWNQYRAVKKSENEPTFLLENVFSKEVGEAFKKAGFKEIHTYTSNKGKIKDAYYDEILDDMEKELKQENIKIRKFNKKNAHSELKKMFEVAKASFTNNPLYTDIKEEEFIEKYEKFIDLCDEKFILIAEKNKETIGFLFSMPNINPENPDAPVSCLILKTIAVKPKYEDFAIGNIMLNRIRETALENGFKEWIFAFMYKNNTSQRMAQRNKAKEIREYNLYGKEL